MILLMFCFKAWKKINANIIAFQIKKVFSIKVAKMFQTKVKYLPSRKGERYASALSSMSLNNKVLKNFGKIHLKDYVKIFSKIIRK